MFTVRLLSLAEEGIDCGCFGGAGSEVSRIHVSLNAVACLVCASAVVWPPHAPSWIFERTPLSAVATCIGIAAIAYASLVAFTVLPRAWQSYGKGAPS
jgi:hypothetical protein